MFRKCTENLKQEISSTVRLDPAFQTCFARFRQAEGSLEVVVDGWPRRDRSHDDDERIFFDAWINRYTEKGYPREVFRVVFLGFPAHE